MPRPSPRPYTALDLIRMAGRIVRLIWAEQRGPFVTCLLFGTAWPLLGLVQPMLFGRLIDALNHNNLAATRTLLWIWAALLLAFLVSLYVNRLTSDHVKHGLKARMGERFAQRALTMGYDFYARNHSSWLLKVMTRGDEALGNQAHEIMGWWLGYTVSLAAMVPLVLYLNFMGGLVVLGLCAAVAAALSFIFNKSGRQQVRLEDMMTRLYAHAGDAYANAVPLQSYAAIDWTLRRISAMINRRLKLQKPILTWWAISNAFAQSTEKLAVLLIAAVGVGLVTHGTLTVGGLVSFILIIGTVLPHLIALQERFERLFWEYPYINDFLTVLDSQPEIADGPDTHPLEVKGGHVVFDNVSFTYKGRGQVLNHVSFEIPPGKTVALVGATGAGKTTIARLLLRYYDPTSGTISIDGQPLPSVTLSSLRDAITVLFQESFVLNQNVINNLRMGRMDRTDPDISQAIDSSLFTSVLDELPEGLATQLGERGVKLSGGERQRLAIARALLRDSPILILDEATSALDAATEAILKESLKRLTRNRTTLVIAHRLSTIRHADEILVLKQGQIAERGTYRQLLDTGGIFTRLVAAQQDGVIGE
jgi:ATP-binding cassette subfamily B protein